MTARDHSMTDSATALTRDLRLTGRQGDITGNFLSKSQRNWSTGSWDMAFGSYAAQWFENAWTRGTLTFARSRTRDPIGLKLGGSVEDTHTSMLSKFEHSEMNRPGVMQIWNHAIENCTFSWLCKRSFHCSRKHRRAHTTTLEYRHEIWHQDGVACQKWSQSDEASEDTNGLKSVEVQLKHRFYNALSQSFIQPWLWKKGSTL